MQQIINRVFLSSDDITSACKKIACDITRRFSKLPVINIYGIPKGGVCAAYALSSFIEIRLVLLPSQADVIIDDIINTGKKEKRFLYYNKPFYSIVDKRLLPELKDFYFVFPWEMSEQEFEFLSSTERKDR